MNGKTQLVVRARALTRHHGLFLAERRWSLHSQGFAETNACRIACVLLHRRAQGCEADHPVMELNSVERLSSSFPCPKMLDMLDML
jgi:hypothetical protein